MSRADYLAGLPAFNCFVLSLLCCYLPMLLLVIILLQTMSIRHIHTHTLTHRQCEFSRLFLFCILKKACLYRPSFGSWYSFLSFMFTVKWQWNFFWKNEKPVDVIRVLHSFPFQSSKRMLLWEPTVNQKLKCLNNPI